MVKIFVGRIPNTVTKDRLRDLFSQYGKVTECEIVKDYGFVHMDSEEASETAIRELHNHSVEGGNITVERSHGRPSKKSEDGGGRRLGPGRGDDRRGGPDRGPPRRDGGFRGRDRSPIDRRGGGDYGRGGYSRGGGGGGDYGRGRDDRYGGDRDRGYGGGYPDDRGYGGGYDARLPPISLPSATPYYDARPPAPVYAAPSYGNGYDRADAGRYGAPSGGSYGSAPGYGAPPASGYGGPPPPVASSYDNYDRYGSYSRGGSAGRYDSGGSRVPAAGVTRRY